MHTRSKLLVSFFALTMLAGCGGADETPAGAEPGSDAATGAPDAADAGTDGNGGSTDATAETSDAATDASIDAATDAIDASGDAGDDGDDGATDAGPDGGADAGCCTPPDGGDAGACVGQPVVAPPVPLDLYVMFDQSGSMSDTVAGGATKWDALTGALEQFVGQPLTNVSVGLQYFGLPAQSGCPATCISDGDCGAFGPCFVGICFACAGPSDSCNAADYTAPDVEVAPVPANAAAIAASLHAHAPNTATPTAPALQGALDHAKAWATAHPDHRVTVILATDGQPSECNPTDQAGIAQIAATALAGTPSVSTLGIGIFAPADVPGGPDLLDAVSAAGGTGKAFNFDTSDPTIQQQLVAALNSIRGRTCRYAIPTVDGGAPDFALLNVAYVPGGGTPVAVPQVQHPAHCPVGSDAWYYDDPASPTSIVLCPATCVTVSADASTTVDVVLGCPTNVAP